MNKLGINRKKKKIEKLTIYTSINIKTDISKA